MRKIAPILFSIFVFILLWCTQSAHAASFSYSAWVPYWKKDTAPAAAMENLDRFSRILPFSYEIGKDGSLVDKMKVNEDPWRSLLQTAKDKKITIIPSVAWADADAIDATLRDPKKRAAHIVDIIKVVAQNGYDGIDIDYENKKAETNLPFSAFLQELSKKMAAQKKELSCSLEARTPLTSRFSTAPKTLDYANDYKVIASACQTIHILAYDQRRIDIKLNLAKGGPLTPYIPVADPVWVEKVLKEALKTLPRNKIVLALPTFGYDWKVTNLASPSLQSYEKMQSLNWSDAMALASSTNSKVIRNAAGELSFSYTKGTSTRVVWFSDAASLKDKLALAKKYRLKGVALFKAEKELDPALWSILK